jgi:hypothetical protein
LVLRGELASPFLLAEINAKQKKVFQEGIKIQTRTTDLSGGYVS